MAEVILLPRFIRVGQAHKYLGMCRALFEKEVRPQLTEIRIGQKGKAFDRLELDQQADAYKAKNKIDKADAEAEDKNRIGLCRVADGGSTWQSNHQPTASSCEAKSGTSAKPSSVSAFRKALERATGKKRNTS